MNSIDAVHRYAVSLAMDQFGLRLKMTELLANSHRSLSVWY